MIILKAKPEFLLKKKKKIKKKFKFKNNKFPRVAINYCCKAKKKSKRNGDDAIL